MKNLIGMFAVASLIVACNGNTKSNSQENLNAIKHYNDSLKLDSFRKVEVLEKQKQADEREQAAIAAKVAAEKRASLAESRAYRSTRTHSHYQSASQPVYQEQAPTRRKGWSSAAKGAVIGGVVGAGTGILVDKKNGRGAVIGGVVGAGTGYVIGRSRDRRSGRVQ